MNCMPITSFLFLLFTLVLLPATAADLITATCNHTLYCNICVASLLSDPRSRGADLRGLAAISLDLATTQANKTLYRIRIMRAASTGAGAAIGSRARMALDDCLEQYGDADKNLKESAAALVQADYPTVNTMVSAAMTDADSCAGGFEEGKGMRMERGLRMLNDYFGKLCSISLAITALLS